MADATAPLLRMRGIAKRFPGVTALDRVDLTVGAGEVHLLLGENGAGKSTLVKILSGAYTADEGTIELGGARVEIPTPLRARQLGISMIYQEMNLVPHLTLAENIFLGREPSRFGFIRRRRMEDDARALLDRLHAGFGPDVLVKDLAVAQQQLVEISKALSFAARVIIMDEPTASLTQREVEDLFGLIRSLRQEGFAVIYITHRLEEARAIGDRVTVLRDGAVVGSGPLAEFTDAALVTLMVGREMAQLFPELPPPTDREVLRVEALERAGSFGPVSLTVHAGEILGIAGLIGSGRTELARGLIGADPTTGGAVTVDGRTRRFTSPREAKAAGVCLLPEDRKGQGLILGQPVLRNVSLASLDRFSRFGFIRGRAERQAVGGLVDRLRIRTTGLDQLARLLSGGNQQKVVLAKWLAVEPKVLIFDEPTRGIDVGARFEVYKLMTALAAEGAALIMISSDLVEVLGMSHRVAVMRGGRIEGILPRSQASPESVMHLAMGLATAPR